MRYKRFEDTPVWRAGAELGERVFLLVEDPAFTGCGDIRNQLQRAALSVTNNIAEGFERGTTDTLIMFLYYAKGSAGEVRSTLRIAARLPRFGHLKSQISNLISLTESISRQLAGWTDALQNSDIKGQRHLTDAAREELDRKRRAQAFLEQLERARLGTSGEAQ